MVWFGVGWSPGQMHPDQPTRPTNQPDQTKPADQKKLPYKTKLVMLEEHRDENVDAVADAAAVDDAEVVSERDLLHRA